MIYTSRNGSPEKVLPVLQRFLNKFWQEREISGEFADTPACLVAQITVRFGFESCEDDFSNIRVGVTFNPTAEYLYHVGLDRSLKVWVAEDAYRKQPDLGLQACRPWTP
jgi:hypothetical protein